MYLNFLLPTKIKEIFRNMDEIPELCKSECMKLKSENDKISDFCSFYNTPCAPSHYQNLFLDFDTNIERRLLFASNTAKKLLLKDKKTITDGLTREKQSPQEYSFLLLIMMCERFLGSGSYHIYRGILSPEGHTFALIHYLLLIHAERQNFLSLSQKKEIIDHVNKLIKNAG
jgi:hypothetical protein